MTAPKLSGPQEAVLRELAKPGVVAYHTIASHPFRFGWAINTGRMQSVAVRALIKAGYVAVLPRKSTIGTTPTTQATITPAGRAYLAALDGAK